MTRDDQGGSASSVPDALSFSLLRISSVFLVLRAQTKHR